MRRLFLAILVSLASFCAAQSLSPEVKQFVKIDRPVIALKHVRVIDGSGGPVRQDQMVVIAQGRIRSIGDAKSASVPDGAQAIELEGYSVIPGLVGMHDHMFYPMGDGIYGEMAHSFPRLYLAGGVTTIRTTGSLEPYTDLELKRQIDSGSRPGPKIHVTGPYLEGQGSWALQMHQLTGPADAEKTVNYWIDEGVDNFKAYNFITSEELRAAIETAHRRGVKVTGHLCSIGFREAARLGIDDLEHGLLVDTEFFAEKKPDQCPEIPDEFARYAKMDVHSQPIQEMIRDLIEHHVAVTSTLPVFEMVVPGRPTMQQRVLDALSLDARAAVLQNKVRAGDEALIRKRYQSESSPWTAAFKREMEFEREFASQGGRLLAGLDPTGMGGVIAGFGDQRELELLVEAGFPPLEAIKIATLNGAEYLGDSEKIGTLAPGKQADLVLVKGDPSENIGDIENVEVVFKDGVGYDSRKLAESVRGLVGSR